MAFRFTALLLVMLAILATSFEAFAEAQHVLKGRIIRSIAIEPGDANHLLVGQKAAKPGSALVFQSLDGGKTWLTLNSNRPLARDATDVQAVAAVSKDRLLAGTWKHGLYLSSDGGRSFERVTDFPSNDVRDLQVAEGVVYAATGRDGVFASDDRGKNWRSLGADKIFLWSLTASNGALFTSSPEAGVLAYQDQSWRKIFDADKAYALAADAMGGAGKAIAGETGLHVFSNGKWLTLITDHKFADVLFIDDKRLLAASWSHGISMVTNDGTLEKRLLDDQPIIHLNRTGDKLYIGTWGRGLHILSLADVLSRP